jgi:hypothetical protein
MAAALRDCQPVAPARAAGTADREVSVAGVTARWRLRRNKKLYQMCAADELRPIHASQAVRISADAIERFEADSRAAVPSISRPIGCQQSWLVDRFKQSHGSCFHLSM